MPRDRFVELETFVAVVESGSLSGAAERLGVAVSAVSRRLGELESRLGVRLANRSSRGLAVVAPVLHAFAAERPSLRLDVDYADRRVDLVEEGFDVAVRIGELEDSRLVARRLGDVVHVVAASPTYSEALVAAAEAGLGVVREPDFIVREAVAAPVGSKRC